MALERFPLPEGVAYSYAQNFTATHRGTDIMAPFGTPVLAVERGVAWSNIEPKGGQVVYLDSNSGRRYFYGHLSEWALHIITATQQQPWEVEAGDELGKVGNSGNAEGRPPHLHFQMRSSYHRGWSEQDPFPELVAVDPHTGRGRPSSGGSSAVAGAVFLLAVIWALKGK